MSDEDLFLELRERGRSVTRTPTSQRRRKYAPPRTPAQRGRSRSRSAQPKTLRFRSASNKAEEYHREAVSLLSRPKDERFKFDIYHLNKGKSMDQIDRMWKRRKAGKFKLKTRKVRHKNARKVLKKMPAGGRSYARGRKSMKKPKGAYRGAVLPRFMKGETKHILWQDSQDDLTAAAGNASTESGKLAAPAASDIHATLDIGDIKQWSMNPVEQGTSRTQRNGASVDGTYLRIQGHLANQGYLADAMTVDDDGDSDTAAVAQVNANAKQRAYVRMLVLSVKGGRAAAGTSNRPKANFEKTQLFKKIDGTIVGFDESTGAGKAAARMRTLQLGVNKGTYTLLADRKFELSSSAEGFGASDRLFDMKIPLKQRTTFSDGNADSWEKNQIVFCVMTVDPNMNDSAIGTSSRANAIQLEFESKYSYKDF